MVRGVRRHLSFEADANIRHLLLAPQDKAWYLVVMGIDDRARPVGPDLDLATASRLGSSTLRGDLLAMAQGMSLADWHWSI